MEKGLRRLIPKRIIWCWFGNKPLSELNKRCIESWSKCCPDYEIVKIDESNFDYNSIPYSKEAYQKKNWAYVSDIARLEALKKLKGFYLDTDVELYRSLDDIRDNNAIIHEQGYGMLGTGILGCDRFPKLFEKSYKKLKSGMAYYDILDREAFKMYDRLGDDIEKEDDLTIYGIKYFGNSRVHTDQCIGVHWDNNSWYEDWTGGFKPLNDFVPFAIYRDGKLDKETTELWFGNIPEDKLYVDANIEINIDIMELGNYFKNSKVMKLEKKSVRFERTSNTEKEMISKRLSNGCILTYTK